MNVTDKIYDAIVSNPSITVEDNIFKYVVPENFHTHTNQPIVRITPLPYNPNDYADNEELTREYDYQVDIWWSENEPEQQSESIVKELKKLNLKVYYREPLYEIETLTFREIIRANGSLFI